tara:strand:+ start:101535 stop:102203 length:669 start_codon:yes stop_codon:yes gene_type:complete
MLHSLSHEAYSLLTPAFCEGELERYSDEITTPYLEEAPFEMDLVALDAAVEEILATTPKHSTSVDAVAAQAIHRAMPISRRWAAEAGLWRYLAVVRHPELIRHRWEARSLATTRQRYWSLGTRHTSNTFCRLWWIAELTVRDGSYALTEKACGNLAIPLFVRQLSHCPTAVQVFVEELHEVPRPALEALMKHISHYLSTVVLESQSEAEIRTWLRRLRDSSG